MLLDALHKAPPRSVDELAVFFERSRGRLENSLDKGQVTGEERQRYLQQFQDGLNEAQVDFLNTALDHHANGSSAPGLATSNGGGLMSTLKATFQEPVMWAMLAVVLIVGIALGMVVF
ncbi:MAG: hypothetical protein AAF590_02375 [Pseudomonadota bacterium]